MKKKNLEIQQLGYLKESELNCLFEGVEGIESIQYDGNKLSIVVTDERKYFLLKLILDENLGEEEKLINLDISYKRANPVTTDDIEYLFKGSTHFSRIYNMKVPGMPPRIFIGFKKEAVQYYSDDFSKPDGMTTTVTENLAYKYLNVNWPFFTETN